MKPLWPNFYKELSFYKKKFEGLYSDFSLGQSIQCTSLCSEQHLSFEQFGIVTLWSVGGPRPQGFYKVHPSHFLKQTPRGQGRAPVHHFLVPPGLCIKTRLSAQPLIWKWFFILMQVKLIFTRKFEQLASFWKWEFWGLGSGLLTNRPQLSDTHASVWCEPLPLSVW